MHGFYLPLLYKPIRNVKRTLLYTNKLTCKLTIHFVMYGGQ